MTGGAGLGDVWEWDGASWTSVPAFGTYAAGALAFDPEHGLVFVGQRSGVAELETHLREANGSWRLIDPPAGANTPAPIVQPGIALDARRRTVVMAGGSVLSAISETWEWDGRWTRRGDLPVALSGIQMAYDVVRDEMIVFGVDAGNNAAMHRLARSTGTWGTPVPAGSDGPSRRVSYAMVYDEELDRVVMFGGANAGGVALADTWLWNGADSTWTEVTPAESPSPRANPAAVYDPIRKSVLIFGGADGIPPNFELNAELWEWSLDPGGEHRWHRRVATVAPPGRTGAAMAWDPARRRVVLFGGLAGQLPGNDPDLLGDTWELEWVGDEPRWTPIATSTSPANRTGARMTPALDGAGVTVFGGIGVDLEGLSDVFTMRWDGGIHEGCGRIDGDGDGDIGCADADCWYVCTPTCAPRQPCVALQVGCELEPICTGAETCVTCPEDCGTCTPWCGDLVCDSSEDATSCPLDCAE
jgi:hypothetical protein